jgi:hypothetical protein
MSFFLLKPFQSILPKNFFNLNTIESSDEEEEYDENSHLISYENENNNSNNNQNKITKESGDFYQETMYSSQTNGHTEMCKIILFPNMKITINAISDKAHEQFYITLTFQIQSAQKMYKMHYIVSYSDLLAILKWNKPEHFLHFIKSVPQSSSTNFKKSILRKPTVLASRPMMRKPPTLKYPQENTTIQPKLKKKLFLQNMNNNVNPNINHSMNMDNNENVNETKMGKMKKIQKIKKLKPLTIKKKKIQSPSKSFSSTPKIHAKTYKKTIKRPSTKLVRRKYAK